MSTHTPESDVQPTTTRERQEITDIDEVREICHKSGTSAVTALFRRGLISKELTLEVLNEQDKSLGERFRRAVRGMFTH